MKPESGQVKMRATSTCNQPGTGSTNSANHPSFGLFRSFQSLGFLMPMGRKLLPCLLDSLAGSTETWVRPKVRIEACHGSGELMFSAPEHRPLLRAKRQEAVNRLRDRRAVLHGIQQIDLKDQNNMTREPSCFQSQHYSWCECSLNGASRDRELEGLFDDRLQERASRFEFVAKSIGVHRFTLDAPCERKAKASPSLESLVNCNIRHDPNKDRLVDISTFGTRWMWKRSDFTRKQGPYRVKSLHSGCAMRCHCGCAGGYRVASSTSAVERIGAQFSCATLLCETSISHDPTCNTQPVCRNKRCIFPHEVEP